jgi:predicted nucleic acid-binding protein
VARGRAQPAGGDPLIRTLVLDSEGVSKAAQGHRDVQIHLTHAFQRRARVVASAATLVEILRGGKRDASVHRALRLVTVEPLTQELCRRAGELLGQSGLGPEDSIDAMVAATAINQPRPVLILTSDPKDLAALTSTEAGITIAHI